MASTHDRACGGGGGPVETLTIPELEAAPDATVSRRMWTERDVAVLKKYVRSKGTVAVGKALGRSLNSVRNKCSELGMRSIPT